MPFVDRKVIFIIIPIIFNKVIMYVETAFTMHSKSSDIIPLNSLITFIDDEFNFLIIIQLNFI